MIRELIVAAYVLLFTVSILLSYFTYLVGYKKGFNQCKEIDDKILNELLNKSLNK